jgi:ribosome biogenesis GTPase
VVVSIRKPPLHHRLIDRYLVAVQQGGAATAVCVNKVDLAESEAELAVALAKLKPYEELGLSIVCCSAEQREGMAELRQLLAGKVSAFVGHSGVGKTSILNALLPELALDAKEVHHLTGQGRHTTTASTMYDIGDGARVVDTPGIRAFGLDFSNLAELAVYFPEFEGRRCRFSDCTHLHEPECGVKEAVAAGAIVRERYETYRRMAGDVSPATAPQAGFECRNCGESVPAEGAGSEHRNHCPRCLHSVHLDSKPGDRAAGCGGTMEPVAVWVRRGGEWAVIHRCRTCGQFGSNRIAADDNEVLLMSLAVRPLAQPPFPLDRL